MFHLTNGNILAIDGEIKNECCCQSSSSSGSSSVSPCYDGNYYALPTYVTAVLSGYTSYDCATGILLEDAFGIDGTYYLDKTTSSDDDEWGCGIYVYYGWTAEYTAREFRIILYPNVDLYNPARPRPLWWHAAVALRGRNGAFGAHLMQTAGGEDLRHPGPFGYLGSFVLSRDACDCEGQVYPNCLYVGALTVS